MGQANAIRPSLHSMVAMLENGHAHVMVPGSLELKITQGA